MSSEPEPETEENDALSKGDCCLIMFDDGIGGAHDGVQRLIDSAIEDDDTPVSASPRHLTGPTLATKLIAMFVVFVQNKLLFYYPPGKRL